MPKKDGSVKFSNFEGKTKLPYLIYADLECFPVSEDNGKQNPEESYMSLYSQLWIFSKSFKSCLGEDVAYNLLIAWSKRLDIAVLSLKKHFNKKLVMTRKDEEFKTPLIVGSVINFMSMIMLK